MYPTRMAGRRIFVPEFGILPYIRGLQMEKKNGVFVWKVKAKGETFNFYCHSEDYKTPLMTALKRLEELGEGNKLWTCRALRTTESPRKQNPTGYAGVYKLSNSSSWAYRVTCPYETDEPTSSLSRAALIREAAVEEFYRKNTFTVAQLLSQVERVELHA